jgi:hypothetical protein
MLVAEKDWTPDSCFLYKACVLSSAISGGLQEGPEPSLLITDRRAARGTATARSRFR